jgi:hypothetical protein
MIISLLMMIEDRFRKFLPPRVLASVQITHRQKASGYDGAAPVPRNVICIEGHLFVHLAALAQEECNKAQEFCFSNVLGFPIIDGLELLIDAVSDCPQIVAADAGTPAEERRAISATIPARSKLRSFGRYESEVPNDFLVRPLISSQEMERYR